MKAIVKTSARGLTNYTEFSDYEEALNYHKNFMEHDNVESVLIKTEVTIHENTYE